MTIGAAWVRRGRDSKELWIASDSRLTGTSGYIWDSCPKLSTLPRRDTVLGFAGGTQEAFPLMLQISSAVGSYRALTEGILEFYHVIGHLELVINDMMAHLTPDPQVRTSLPWGTEFSTGSDTVVIAGYSRRASDFVIRYLRYEQDLGVWKFSRVPSATEERPRVLHIFGDAPSKAQFRTRLHFLLKEIGKLGTAAPLDMEPLRVICAMLSLPASPVFEEVSGRVTVPAGFRSRTIGGAPQVIQLLPGAASTPMVVRWPPDNGSGDYLFGRQLLRYENVDLPLLTVEANGPRIHAPWHWPPSTVDGSAQNPGATDTPPTEPPLPIEEDPPLE